MAETKTKPKAKTTKKPKGKTQEKSAETGRTWTEEIEVAGEQLVQRVKQLAADAQVQRIRVTEPDGDIALDIPLTFGAIAGGAVVIAAPVLAVIGALAALVSKVKIEIVREEDKPK